MPCWWRCTPFNAVVTAYAALLSGSLTGAVLLQHADWTSRHLDGQKTWLVQRRLGQRLCLISWFFLHQHVLQLSRRSWCGFSLSCSLDCQVILLILLLLDDLQSALDGLAVVLALLERAAGVSGGGKAPRLVRVLGSVQSTPLLAVSYPSGTRCLALLLDAWVGSCQAGGYARLFIHVICCSLRHGMQLEEFSLSIGLQLLSQEVQRVHRLNRVHRQRRGHQPCQQQLLGASSAFAASFCSFQASFHLCNWLIHPILTATATADAPKFVSGRARSPLSHARASSLF